MKRAFPTSRRVNNTHTPVSPVAVILSVLDDGFGYARFNFDRQVLTFDSNEGLYVNGQVITAVDPASLPSSSPRCKFAAQVTTPGIAWEAAAGENPFTFNIPATLGDQSGVIT